MNIEVHSVSASFEIIPKTKKTRNIQEFLN